MQAELDLCDTADEEKEIKKEMLYWFH